MVSLVIMNNHNGKRKKDEITCIQLSKETRNKLAEIGSMNDTFESVILDLMNRPESCNVENGESQNGE